jgi:hypothetical protein
MAINTSNSNYVNISNLPRVQEALDTDLLILQTENGTQTISFGDLNTVKTDAAGNATVVGGLTGNSAVFSSISASGYISSVNYYSGNGAKGIYAANGFYNRFTINAGLVTSADINIGSPEYVAITTNILPNLTAWQDTQYRRIIDYTGSATILANNTYNAIEVANFYLSYPQIGSSSLKSTDFFFTATSRLSSVPYLTNLNDDNFRTSTNNLYFRLNLGYAVPVNTVINWRLLYTY